MSWNDLDDQAADKYNAAKAKFYEKPGPWAVGMFIIGVIVGAVIW